MIRSGLIYPSAASPTGRRRTWTGRVGGDHFANGIAKGGGGRTSTHPSEFLKIFFFRFPFLLFGCSSSLSGLLPSRLNPLAGRSFGPLAARESEATTIAGQSFSRSRQHAPTTQAGQNSRLPCFRSPRHGRPALCGWPLRAMMVVASALARRLKKTRADGWCFYLRFFFTWPLPTNSGCLCRVFAGTAFSVSMLSRSTQDGWMAGMRGVTTLLRCRCDYRIVVPTFVCHVSPGRLPACLPPMA